MQNTSRRQTLLLFSIIFWVLFVLGGYYYFHKPISIEMISPPLSALIDVLFALLFAGLAGGLGRRLLRAESVPSLERAALQFALGAGALSLTWFALGVLGLYRFPLAAPLLILGWVLLWRDARTWYRQFREVKTAWSSAGGLEKALAGLAVVLILYQLLISLAPPIKWDALTYHLQLPRQYLAAGRLVFVPENPYWGHPELVEMLYVFAMSFHRAETAAVLGWSAGVIFLLGLLGFANSSLARLKNEEPGESAPAAGWMAVTAVLAGYTFRYLLGWSYTDLFSALFGLAALIAFFEWLDAAQPAWLLWTGLFCGMALGTKWTDGVLALGLFCAALVFRKRGGSGKPLTERSSAAAERGGSGKPLFYAAERGGSGKPLFYAAERGGLSFKTWLAAGAVAFLAVLPWLAKNWIVTGSPLYPYIFGTPWFNTTRLASANLPPETIEWWQHLLLPISTTWAGIDSAPGFAADLGPLLVLLAAPGFWLYRRSAFAQTLGIVLGFTALAMGIASLRFEHLIQTRVYFAALACLALPAGWGWDWLQRQVIQGVRVRRILNAVILLVMGLIFWQDSYFIGQITPGRFSLGTQTKQEYLENTVGYTIRAGQALEALPPGSRILMLWEPRGLYFPLNAQADPWIDRWRTDRRELGNAPAILVHWKSEGFTHALFYQPGIDLIRPQPGQAPSADWTVLQDLLKQLPAPTAIGEMYLLYPLK